MSRRNHDDILGGDDEDDSNVGMSTADVHLIAPGVSVPWLMRAFRMGRTTIERSLIGVRPVGLGKHSTPLYDLPAAAARLVRPDVDMEKFLRSIKPEDLPTKLQSAFWEAKLRRQKYEEKAGNLWRTERVITLYASVLQEIRLKLTIIPDTVERSVGLTPEQMKSVSGIVDSVQDDIYKFIQELHHGQSTPSTLGEDEDEDEEDDIL